MNRKDLRIVRDKVRARLETTVRRLWMKYALRGIGQNDAHDRLELAYRIPDPWKLDSEPEHFRFAETNRYLKRAFGERVGSVLELGCGEGLQTAVLAQVSDHVTGIDVAQTAVRRAAKRLPQATFAAGDLFSQPWSAETGKFDVVVACEVLYYLSDVPRTLDAMDRLATKGCLVTYFSAAERKIGQYVASRPGVQRDTFRFGAEGETEWVVAWWGH